MYCSNCGSKVNESENFCGNCGHQIASAQTPNKTLGNIKNVDFKKTLYTLKEYFLNFRVDYESKTFKFAMLLLLSIGVGEPLYSIVPLPTNVLTLFPGASTVYSFVLCALLFAIFAIFLLKSKNKQTGKRSDFLIIFWIVALVLNLLVFLASFNLYEYVLFSSYVSNGITILVSVCIVLLLCKNKPQSPVYLLLSALSFAFSNTSLWILKSDISLYNILKSLNSDETAKYFMEIISESKYILLVLLVFLLAYIIPRKISKWLICVPTLSVIVLNFIDLVKNFSFTAVLDFIIEIGISVVFALFALSCSRETKQSDIVEAKENRRKSVLKIGILSVSVTAVIVIAGLLSSALVCSSQINSGIAKWKSDIVAGKLTDSNDWDSMNKDVFKYSCAKFAAPFVDEYSFYTTLKENRYTMKNISTCYTAYQNNRVTDDIVDTFSNISADETWANNSILSVYHKKYLEMQPVTEKITVRASVSVDHGKIEITVRNDNVMPISKCTVDCDFTILFIEASTYSDNEYGRGTKTIVIEDINGKSEKTQTVSFDPDDYYDGYGSYILATLWDKSISAISIE